MPTRYPKQQIRERVTPPHVGLVDLRLAVGITLEELARRIEKDSNGEFKPSRGTLSALENGTRGASVELLTAISVAYGLRPEALTTNYEPRARATAAEEVAS